MKHNYSHIISLKESNTIHFDPRGQREQDIYSEVLHEFLKYE